MLLGVERAVARAAGHVIGRQVKPTGRRGRAIEETTRFRLLSIEPGNICGDPRASRGSRERRHTERRCSFARATRARERTGDCGGEETEQVDVAEAFVRLVDDVGVGSRFRSPTLEEEGPAGRKMVTLDRPGARQAR
jgi:hypothetical protein